MSEIEKRSLIEEFKNICRSEFSYLCNDFDFREDTSPPAQHENEFKIKFVRQDLVVIVEGIHYGSTAMVSLENSRGHRISVQQLNPDFQPLKRMKTKAQRPGQIEDIKREASLLKQYGSELLRGDLSQFEKAIEKMDVAWNEYQNRRAYGVAVQEAVDSFKKQEWQKVIDVLEPYEEEISKRMKNKLKFSRKQINPAKQGD